MIPLSIDISFGVVMVVAMAVAAIAFVIRDEKRATGLEAFAASFHERLAALEVRWTYLAEHESVRLLEQRVDALEKLNADAEAAVDELVASSAKRGKR